VNADIGAGSPPQPAQDAEHEQEHGHRNAQGQSEGGVGQRRLRRPGFGQPFDGQLDTGGHTSPQGRLIEIFFVIITRQAIRRGGFTSVKDLIAAIQTFIDGWNDRCTPFVWTKTADQIIPHTTKRQATSIARH